MRIVFCLSHASSVGRGRVCLVHCWGLACSRCSVSVHELGMLNEVGGDVGMLEGRGVWAGVAWLGPTNAGSAPCHGQQLCSAFCFCPGPLQEGFCVRTVYKAMACGTVGILRLLSCLEVLTDQNIRTAQGLRLCLAPLSYCAHHRENPAQDHVMSEWLCQALNLPKLGPFCTQQYYAQVRG